jgi:hypothetical protein
MQRVENSVYLNTDGSIIKFNDNNELVYCIEKPNTYSEHLLNGITVHDRAILQEKIDSSIRINNGTVERFEIISDLCPVPVLEVSNKIIDNFDIDKILSNRRTKKKYKIENSTNLNYLRKRKRKELTDNKIKHRKKNKFALNYRDMIANYDFFDIDDIDNKDDKKEPKFLTGTIYDLFSDSDDDFW